MKLLIRIKKYLEEFKHIDFPIEFTNTNLGCYYDFSKFSLLIQDLKEFPNEIKISWIFYRKLDSDEKAYWGLRYTFRLDDNSFTQSRIRLPEISNNKDVQFVMSRQVSSLRIFEKDLRWVIKMEKLKEGKS